MMSLILNLGVDDTFASWLKIKIRLTNALALILAFIATAFSIASYIYFSAATYIPIAAIFICLIIFPLNMTSLFTTARFILSTLPVTLTVLFSSCLSNNAQNSSPFFWGLAMAFMTISFVLFDSREINLNVLCFVFCVVPLFFFRKLNILLEYEVESLFVINLFDSLAFISSLLVLASALFWFQREVRESEKVNSSLLANLNAKNTQMEHTAAELKRVIAGLESKELLDKQQSWISQGVSFFLKTFRSANADSNTLDGMLKHMVTYSRASHGALFIFNDTEDVLELKSSYAYNRKKYLEKIILKGEGLVGQCFLEKSRIYMTDIPRNYITITSGLGEALPTSICICPLITNDTIEGVLELAFFGKVEQQVLSFCDRACEAIATIIREQRDFNRNRKLLMDSQKLTEELKLKEEQMKQSVNELISVQAEMERKEKEYLNRIYELTELTTN